MPNSHRHVLAGDLGSSSCKTILWRDDGQVVAAASREYPTHYPAPNAVEQHPLDWWDAFVATTREVLEKAGPDVHSTIEAVGLVGVTHNTVLLDRNFQPLRPCILLFDGRSVAECAELRARFGVEEIRRQVQNDVSPMWTWPQLLWLKRSEPEVWKRVHALLFQKDFVRWQLTGKLATDEIDAAGSLFWNALERRWVDSYLEAIAVPQAWLPPVLGPRELAGRITAEAARATGLREGTSVIAGTTDTVAEVLGAGANTAGDGIIKLASVGRIAVVGEHPILQPHVINYRHVLEGLWYPGTSCKHAASAYKWLRDLLCSEEEQRLSNIFERLDDLAARAAPGSGGVLFHPHLSGQWAPHFDEQLRASFTGLSLSTTRGDIVRSVLEGVAFALREALEDFESSGGGVASRLLLIGEGARSPLWRDILASVLDRTLVIPAQTGASYGAALLTAAGAGMLDWQANSLGRVTSINATQVTPDPMLSKVYEAAYQRYTAVIGSGG